VLRRSLALVSVVAAAAFAAAPNAPAATHVVPAAGVVDVTTNLAYENSAAAGTGMVLTGTGEVLTNNHVIRGATTIHVTIPSTGKTYPATVVGYSVPEDVAVLQLTGASHLRTVTLGRSALVKVGQAVTALGNAQGVGGAPKPAAGKVTGVGLSIVATDGEGHSEQLTGLIKTNALLEPGDSGGPLLNTVGRVIGMNTAGSVGFYFQTSHEGYAIPIDHAVALAKQIVAGRESATVHIGSTAFLGVSIDTSGNQTTAGALIGSVVPGSPADQAGLVAGDTITAVDGTSVAGFDSLATLLLQHHGGDAVDLQWLDQTGTAQSTTLTTAAGPPQ
jgi:S1-C subfamily serine protease